MWQVRLTYSLTDFLFMTKTIKTESFSSNIYLSNPDKVDALHKMYY